MNTFTKEPVVVPWDFSDLSQAALDKALELVESPEQIIVVHVTSYPAVAEPSVVWGTYSEDNIRENLEKSFHKVVPQDKYPGMQFSALFGDPGTEIARLARDRKAGLIVISSHGRSGIPRMLLGSVAERVVRLASCPVLVLRSDDS
jgi:nucleotide-binding universal stress UspA family protein